VDCDLVLIGTPIDLGRLLDIDKPAQRVRCCFESKGEVTRAKLVGEFLDRRPPKVP
jgi:predicted GTPase